MRLEKHDPVIELPVIHHPSKTWIAFVMGRDEKYGLRRAFLTPTITDLAGKPDRWKKVYRVEDDGLYEVAFGAMRTYIEVSGSQRAVYTRDEFENDRKGWLTVIPDLR